MESALSWIMLLILILFSPFRNYLNYLWSAWHVSAGTKILTHLWPRYINAASIHTVNKYTFALTIGQEVAPVPAVRSLITINRSVLNKSPICINQLCCNKHRAQVLPEMQCVWYKHTRLHIMWWSARLESMFSRVCVRERPIFYNHICVQAG